MPLPVYVVDAFTDRPFAGNPAAVVLLDEPAPTAWMQTLAGELALPATAFPVPHGDGWALRWFTPAREIPLCGHATLATSHVLARELGRAGPFRYATGAGALEARADDGAIVLDFPAATVRPAPDATGAVAGALFPDGDGPAVEVWRGDDDVLAVLPSAAAVRALRPDHAALGRLGARAVVVSAADETGAHDIVSRVFVPGLGLPEDPVTGSAHCLLGPFWAERLGLTRLRAHQASARGGQLGVAVRPGRVELSGQAVTVSRGELLAPVG